MDWAEKKSREVVKAWTQKSWEIAVRHMRERDPSKMRALNQERSDGLSAHVAAALREGLPPEVEELVEVVDHEAHWLEAFAKESGRRHAAAVNATVERLRAALAPFETEAGDA